MGQFDKDKLPSWVTHCYRSIDNRGTWVEDKTWKLSFDAAPTIFYRLRLLKNRFLSGAINVLDTPIPGANYLNHDLIRVTQEDNGAGHSSSAISSVVVWKSSDSDMTIACTNANLGDVGYGSIPNDTYSIFVQNPDAAVTSQLDSGVGTAYKKIEITKSADFAGLDYFWVEVTFIGDFISPASFNQNLNLTSRVEHDSQIVNKLNVVTSLATKNTYSMGMNIAGSLSIAITGASGTGSIATLTFATQNYIPFTVGQSITVTGVSPAGYNTASAIVTSCTNSAAEGYTVSYSNSTITAYSSGGTVALTTPVLASISGDLLETTQGSATGYLNLQSLPIIARSISSGDGEVYFNQPMTFNAMNKVSVQSSLPRAVTGQGIIADNTIAWNAWKDTAYRFAIQNKKVGFSQAANNPITYDDTSSSAYNIKYASTLQFNPYDSTWQAGLVSEKTSFAGDEATAQSGYGGPTLVGNLPFLVRSADRKSVMNADPGRVAFFNLTNTKGDQLQTDISFKISGTELTTSFNAPKITISNLFRTDNGQTIYQELSNNNHFLGLTSSPATMLTDTGSVIALHEKTTKSATAKFSALRLSLFNEIASLSVKRPSTSYSAVDKDTSLINILSYSLDRSATSDVLNIGDSAVTNLTTNITSDTLYSKITTNHYGYVGSSSSMTATHNFYGDVGMFIDSGTTVAEGSSTKYKLTLRATATTTDTTNKPLIADGGSEYERLSTNGLIRSPSIDKIWDYFRRIVGWSGGTALVNESDSKWNVIPVAYNFALYTEVSNIVSYTNAITYYKPFAWVTTANDNLIAGYESGTLLKGTNPKSLRQLEVELLRERFNTITVTNYIKDRKVDKGISGNDGTAETDYGSLWQLSKAETDYVDGTYKWSDTSTNVTRDRVFLAADGTFQPANSTSVFYLPLVSA